MIVLVSVLVVSNCLVLFLFLQSKKKLERQASANKLLINRGSEFVANVSHELKTPLTSIKGYTETLKEMMQAGRDLEKAKDFLAKIEENSERLGALINDLLDLSKIESLNPHLEIEEFKILPLIENIREQFALSLSKKNQKLVIDVQSESLFADKKLVEQALINLIENAHRYCPDNALIEVRTLHATEEGKSYIEIQVLDNGPGIPESDLPRIFERFYRADKSRNRLSGGTGLGLAIVKHIMLSHGGLVKVSSSPDKGTKFSLLFLTKA